MKVESDGPQAVGDERDEHNEHLDGAGPVGEVGSVVFKRIQLALEMLVALHHRLTQGSPKVSTSRYYPKSREIKKKKQKNHLVRRPTTPMPNWRRFELSMSRSTREALVGAMGGDGTARLHLAERGSESLR